jgi:hypothetical protein
MNGAQRELAQRARELARDRGISPAAALAALRAGPHPPLWDVPDHWADAIRLGTPYLAERWGLTVADVQQLAELLDGESAPPEPADPERAAFSAGLRQIADLLDAHPNIPLPHLTAPKATGWQPTLTCYLWGDDIRATLAAATRAMAAGGRVAKHVDDDGTGLRAWRMFGGIALEVRVERSQVCERVVLGTETVEVEEDACPQCGAGLKALGHDGTMVCADGGEAHYRAAKPGKRFATAEREIVEWRCTPLLGWS